MRVAAPLAVLCLVLLTPAAQADPFSEFRIPDHSWRAGDLTFASAGAWATVGVAGTETRLSAFQSLLQPQVQFARDSDPLRWLVAGSLLGQAGTQDTRQSRDLPGSIIRGDDHLQFSTEEWQVNGQLLSYPWKTPVGLQLTTRVTGENSQDWRRDFARLVSNTSVPVQRTEQATRQDQQAYDYTAQLDLSAGLGRVRDATVVQDIHVLEERLHETGALARPLSPQAREKLAALFYIRPDFSDPHERPERYFWREVERILREDGALGEPGLDPYSVMRADEGYFARIARPCGWFVGPVVSGQHVHQGTRLDQSASAYLFLDDSLALGQQFRSSVDDVTSFDEVDLGGAAEFHRPLGWRWQLDLRTRLTASVRPGDQALHTASAGFLTWSVADRWIAEASLAHTRDYLKRRGELQREEDVWLFDAALQIGWYVEDHTRLSAGIEHTQQRVPFSGAGREFLRLTSFSVSLDYRFLGRLDAPGLIKPMRQMR